MGMWKIEGDVYEDGKITAIYVSHEFYGLNYAKFVPARPRGEWEACLDTEYCKCSHCGTVMMLEESVRFHFCPNCGSDNRPKEDEAE